MEFSGLLQAPAAFSSGIEPLVAIVWFAGCSLERTVKGVMKKRKVFSSYQESNTKSSVVQLIFRLSYPGSPYKRY
jgi:hypothetical protein